MKSITFVCVQLLLGAALLASEPMVRYAAGQRAVECVMGSPEWHYTVDVTPEGRKCVRKRWSSTALESPCTEENYHALVDGVVRNLVQIRIIDKAVEVAGSGANCPKSSDEVKRAQEVIDALFANRSIPSLTVLEPSAPAGYSVADGVDRDEVQKDIRDAFVLRRKALIDGLRIMARTIEDCC